MSPAGMSVSAPMCLLSSRMKAKQNLRISLSDLPLGSKSAPPLPPPMFTVLIVSFIVESAPATGSFTASQSILENLLKAQELQNRKIDRGMETEAAFIGPKGGIELDSIAPVDLDLVLVILPDNAELDDSFGDGGDLEGFFVVGVLLEEGRVLEGRDELCRLCKH